MLAGSTLFIQDLQACPRCFTTRFDRVSPDNLSGVPNRDSESRVYTIQYEVETMLCILNQIPNIRRMATASKINCCNWFVLLMATARVVVTRKSVGIYHHSRRKGFQHVTELWRSQFLMDILSSVCLFYPFKHNNPEMDVRHALRKHTLYKGLNGHDSL